MQKFKQTENKRLSITLDGKEFTVDQLEETKKALLDRIVREDDPAALEGLEIPLTQTNSAIAAIKGAEQAVARTRMEIETKRLATEAEQLLQAEKDQREFYSNCEMIANKKMVRSARDFDPSPYSVTAKLDQPFLAAYLQRLLRGLTFDAAKKQADEIFNAYTEKRQWREVISLPEPVRGK